MDDSASNGYGAVARAFRRADPSRVVVPSSGTLPRPPGLRGSDTHLWLGWLRGHERDLLRLGSRMPSLLRFVGEFGAREALGEEIRYNDVPPEGYRGFDFPGADDLGNMFQFYRDFTDYFVGERDLTLVRQLNPELMTFHDWLAAHADHPGARQARETLFDAYLQLTTQGPIPNPKRSSTT